MRSASVVALGLASCTQVRADTLSTGPVFEPYGGEVRVQLLSIPAGTELGLVQVSGPRTVDELIPVFKKAVAQLGGDLGVIEEAQARFEAFGESKTYSYECGTAQAPRTCRGTQESCEEVLTLRLFGRAFRSCGEPPCLTP